jgi:hypothetical protein
VELNVCFAGIILNAETIFSLNVVLIRENLII